MKNYFMNKSNILTVSIVIILLFSIVSCNPDPNQNVEKRNWELTWSDEFDGAAGILPDAAKWAFDIGNGGWGNQELQYYTNRPENVSLDGNGNLVITAKSESFGGSSYTSARIKTKGLFEQTYGRFEARLKTPYGPGIWPAFWMLGANNQTVAWPQCGEIDIMELKGHQPSVLHSTIHGPGYSGGNAITNTHTLSNSRFDNGYHIFALEWDAEKIDFYVDGYLYNRITKSAVTSRGEWVYDHSFFMILNIAVGGTFAGFPTSETPFPQKMTIDYVRSYKLVD